MANLFRRVYLVWGGAAYVEERIERREERKLFKDGNSYILKAES